MQQIVGVNEIAEMAGVTRQVVVNWRARTADFPQPFQELASGPLFRKTQVRAWLIRNRKKLSSIDNQLGFYDRLKSLRGDTPELSSHIEKVADKLDASSTTDQKPGMLLGKIQSGKTRSFIGIITAAFDRDFDISIVLTKGTKSLSAQTVSRLNSDFKEFLQEDEFLVLDIMGLPGKLTRSELRRKIVIVAKKQANNMERLLSFISDSSDLKNRKILIVDDEADLASIRFYKQRGTEEITQGSISSYVDELREISSSTAYLQVTATPFSLYLQPESYESSYVFLPRRPAFTELVPIHSGYVGGDDYFGSFDPDDPRAHLFVEVSEDEQDALRRPDQRRIHPDRVLENPNTKGLVRAIITFVTAACIRQWQQDQNNKKHKKYAMVIHNDVAKAAHKWQSDILDWIFKRIESCAEENPAVLNGLFQAAYRDLSLSVNANEGKVPSIEDAFAMFIDALISQDVVVERINSDGDVMSLLDENSELRLRTSYNIFVGGNILDRGITIPNLISFYYGRNPRTMQADTVLQHSRMYGNRDRDDLAVTRFYTSERVYDRLYNINNFENSLRSAFQSGAHGGGVVFLRAVEGEEEGGGSIRPCSPNKVLLSNITTLASSALLLPTSFSTIGGAKMVKLQADLDSLIASKWRDSRKFHTTSLHTAHQIIETIENTMVFSYESFDWDAFHSLLEYYSKENGTSEVSVIVETGRALSREGSGDKSGRSIMGTALRKRVLETSRECPTLILLQQLGGRERGWTAHSFWWPILAPPSGAEPCVFAAKVAK